MNNTKLRITELDFNSIRANLKSFLNEQSEFTDYDFDGSGMSVLLDILAYNTHYNSYYLNMIANEMFLDSAVDRDSVVSIAKHLGYVTKSSTSAAATVTLEIKATDSTLPGTIAVPKHTKFTTTIDGTSYVFYTLDSYIADNGMTVGNVRTFTLPNVKLYEGQLGSISYIVSESGFDQKYVIPVKNVDTTSLVVTVDDSATDTTQELYVLHDGLSSVKNDSRVYYLQEVAGEQYEIYFGDGILGKKLLEGNVITIDYLKTNGDLVNGVGSTDAVGSRTFSISSALSYDNQQTSPTTEASVTAVATGGITKPESIASIKFNAPKSFQSQNRAVTKNDYESIILSKYPNAASVMVWGGEDNIPVDPGSVYISLRPVTGLVLNDVQKSELKKLLDNYKVLSITPKVIDPDYTFIKVNSIVTYDKGISLNPKETVKDKVIETIKNYNSVNLSEFDKPFRYSKLVTLIDDSDESIISNTTSITLKKRIKISKSQLGKNITGIDLNFNNALIQDRGNAIGKFRSDVFIDRRVLPIGTNVAGISSTSSTLQDYRVHVADNPATAGLNQVKDLDKSIFNPIVDIGAGIANTIATDAFGSVIYPEGKVDIPILIVDALIEDSEYLYFYVDVVETDVSPSFNQILTILDADIDVTVKTELELKSGNGR